MKNNKKYMKGILKIEVESLQAEKIINFLWKNNIEIRNLRKNTLTNYTMDIDFANYTKVLEAVKRTGGKIKILNRTGPIFTLFRVQRRKTLWITIVIFIGILYYLSSFIWKIDIVTEQFVSPFEIRTLLKSYGIERGTYKKEFDVYELEEKLTADIDEIMWVKTRIDGSRLTVEVVERQAPPKIEENQYTGNIVAKKDGEIDRVYSSAGTAVVEAGKIVKEGDILIKGEQGKEGKEYDVKAEGTVIAKTFHERTVELPKVIKVKERTGNISKSFYINLGDKKFYIKNALKDFESYDKIDNNEGIIKSEVYHETIEKNIETNVDEVVEELTKNIVLNLDKSVKILETKPQVKDLGDKYVISVMLVVEEDIAKEEIVVKEEQEEDKEVEEES